MGSEQEFAKKKPTKIKTISRQSTLPVYEVINAFDPTDYETLTAMTANNMLNKWLHDREYREKKVYTHNYCDMPMGSVRLAE